MQIIDKQDMRGRFFIGVIAPYDDLWPIMNSELLEIMMTKFGQISSVWDPTVNFEAPSSYRRETGSGLTTRIIVFEAKDTKMGLIQRKQASLVIEDLFSRFGKRRFNLNPGIINGDGMYLASHKDGPYRDLLGDNVWIEKQYEITPSGYVAMTNAFDEFSDLWRIKRFCRLYQQDKSHMLWSSGSFLLHCKKTRDVSSLWPFRGSEVFQIPIDCKIRVPHSRNDFLTYVAVTQHTKYPIIKSIPAKLIEA